MRHQHGFAPARGATSKVGMLSRFPVVVRDHLLSDFRHTANRNLRKIDAGLLICIIASVECGAFVARIRGDDGKSPRQCRVAPGGRATHRRPDAAVISAPALEQEAVIPVIRQRERKSDAIGFSVRASALIDHAVGLAV